jgi:hypothetical protein
LFGHSLLFNLPNFFFLSIFIFFLYRTITFFFDLFFDFSSFAHFFYFFFYFFYFFTNFFLFFFALSKKWHTNPQCVPKTVADLRHVCLQGVRGYPTIMALAPHSKSWQEYQGDRSAAAISNWATSLIGNEAVTLKKDSDLTALLAQCGGSSSSSKKKQGSAASWGLCMVLVSSKSSVPSLWKALSVVYKGKVAFGFVAADAKGVLAKLGAAGEIAEGQSSRVVSICNGDVRTAEAYTGERHGMRYLNKAVCRAAFRCCSLFFFTGQQFTSIMAAT